METKGSNLIIKYFAYGSNMCSGRLRDRVPCEFVTVARLSGYQLRFHKLSKKDSSSKGNAFYTGVATDEVWGVVFEIPASKKAVLDAFEGLGYGYEDVGVMVNKAYVLAGAVEHGLPLEYVSGAIEAVVAREDPDKKRHAEETAKLQAWKLK